MKKDPPAYLSLYETIREGKAFPVKLAEALKVIEVIDKVKSGTIYAAK